MNGWICGFLGMWLLDSLRSQKKKIKKRILLSLLLFLQLGTIILNYFKIWQFIISKKDKFICKDSELFQKISPHSSL